MRVLTFSRTYPGYHPKAGEQTFFVEKILESQQIYPVGIDAFQYFEGLNPHLDISIYQDFVRDLVIGGNDPKHHTIRAGHRWKEGDWFKPCVWGDDINPKSGRKGPYQSKQIQFAPPIQVKKTWDFEIDAAGVFALAKPGEQLFYTFQPLEPGSEDKDDQIASNDGLTFEDFYNWFTLSPDFKKNEGFTGQIICWNESIEY